MNALAYFGQQKIQGSSATPKASIADQAGMDAITYSINADPLASNGLE